MKEKKSDLHQIENYTAEKLLHESSHYKIHSATNTIRNKKVIIKEPVANFPGSLAVARLVNEYEIGKTLSHINIIRYLDLVKEGSRIFLVSEYFKSMPLKNYIHENRVEIDDFLGIAIQIADGVSEIHQMDLTHQLIKPSNILINPETRQIKICDFGRSTFHLEEKMDINSFQDSLAYISPEQTGRMNRIVDYRTDFYSLGITFYEMLTGRLPFESTDTMEMVHWHMARQVKPPHEVNARIPEVVSQIILKLLAKTAEERYQSAHGLNIDLTRCLDQLRSNQTIEPFPIGKLDFSSKLQISQKLYGREEELRSLLAAFERVSAGSSELILVSGYSGIGKTVLVNEIHKPIVEKKGYFISGKFDQHTRNIPYSALVMAFESLMRQLLTEPEEQLQRWKKQLSNSLGPNGQVLIDIFPELEKIIGVQPALEPLEPVERRNRFTRLFQDFIHVFTQKEHPVVLFLDDLQWVDSASLDLLKDLMTNSETRFLMIIGAFRDNEVSPEHMLIQRINDIKKEKSVVVELSIGPLLKQHLNGMLKDTFNASLPEIEPLSDLLLSKTAGNPFFVNQFLKNLYELKLVFFDAEQSTWAMDMDRILAQNITDNVADMMINRLQLLSGALQGILPLAACIGNPFDLKMLSVISKHPPARVLKHLFAAIRAGFILPLNEHYKQASDKGHQTAFNSEFKFLHDSVQQAAYALIAEKHKQEVHLTIGRLLLKRFSPKEIADNIFHIVKHLNHGSSLLAGDEKIQLAELNLSAGQKAKNITAYETALEHITIGMDLLSESAWQLRHELTFQLHKNRVELEYLNNNLAESDAFIFKAFSEAISDIEKAEFYNLRIILNTMLGHYSSAVDAGKSALSLLGMKLPENNPRAELQTLIEEIKDRVSDRGISALIHHKETRDPKMLVMIKIMANMLPLTFLSDPELYQIISAKSVILSILHGHAPESSICYSGYGILLVSRGDYQAGFEFGMLALKVSEKSNNFSQKCKAAEVLVAHLNHWIHPMRQFQEIARAAYRAADQSGEIQFAGYTMKYAAGNFLFMGRELTSLQGELLDFLSYATKTQNQIAVDVLTGYLIFTGAIIGKLPKGSSLKIYNLNEENYLKKCHAHKSAMAICIFKTLQCQTFYLLGHYEKAGQCALAAEKFFSAIPGSIPLAQHNFFYSLTLAALCQNASKEDIERYQKQLEINQAQMKIWVENCPDNFLNMHLLVKAEMARMNGNLLEAMDLYDQSIASAHEHEFIQNEAIANELCAKFWLANGKEKFAEIYLLKSRECYREWGAGRKVEDLEEKYPQFFSPSTSVPVKTDAAIAELDVNTVLKASQAISSEIDLKSLLSRIMSILIENAGAQKGALILEQNDEMMVVAEIEGDQNIGLGYQVIPVDSSETVSPAIINYVKRTGEMMVLADASSDERFKADPYIANTHPKSVLCMSIVQQTENKGIIYLENNLATGAFTSDRLQVINLLASQVGISMENARLFEEKQKYADELFEEIDERKRAEAALRESESRYRSVYETAPLAFVVWDAQCRVIEWNDQAEKMFGYQRTEAIGRSFFDLIIPADREFVSAVVKDLLNGKIEKYVVNQNVTQTGKTIWCEWNNAVLRDAEGNVSAAISLGLDITERLDKENELKEYRDRLEEMVEKRTHEIETKNKELETFTYSVSHDLKAPLRGIDGYSRLLSEEYTDKLDEEGLRFLKNIRYSADQMTQLIEDLLTYSRMERRDLRSTQIDIRALIDELVLEREHEISSRSVQVDVKIPTEQIVCDRDSMRQIMGNLLDNAIKFTVEKPQAKIEICGEEAPNTWKFWFKDNGVGFDPKYQDRIFGIFQRLHRAEDYPGTGVGLALVQKAVHRMGGSIRAEGKLGEGAVFCLEMPKSPDKAPGNSRQALKEV